jgi:hypothetical protein
LHPNHRPEAEARAQDCEIAMPDSKEPSDQPPAPSAGARIDPSFADRSAAWDGRRRSKIPTDRAMSGVTLDWVIALPTHLRPKQVCDRYPRIANSLAAVWKDREACVAMLISLLADQRVHRRGFPVVLRQEIQSLLDYREKLAA